jgi:formate dehydrogenase major subunit
MLQEVSRRQFLRGAGAGAAGTGIAALGFGAPEQALAQAVRPFRLSRTTIYSLGDRTKNTHPDIIHIEGDPDHPTNRGTLCPKGAALLDFVHSETRTKHPMYRGPGEKAFRQIGWSEALDRIARLMKDDRDRNLILQNDDGVTVNRWNTVGFLGASATTNETAFCTYKVVRSAGMVIFDNQARV